MLGGHGVPMAPGRKGDPQACCPSSGAAGTEGGTDPAAGGRAADRHSRLLPEPRALTPWREKAGGPSRVAALIHTAGSRVRAPGLPRTSRPPLPHPGDPLASPAPQKPQSDPSERCGREAASPHPLVGLTLSPLPHRMAMPAQMRRCPEFSEGRREFPSREGARTWAGPRADPGPGGSWDP